MSHPFELKISDLKAIELNFEKQLTDEEASTVHGGFHATTNYATITIGEAGEEGGGHFTSEIFGEEGGTTNRIGEEGGHFTTESIGEEGGADT